MSIRTMKCPSCQTEVQYRPEWVGRTGRCKKCSEKFVIVADQETQVFSSEACSNEPANIERISAVSPIPTGPGPAVEQNPFAAIAQAADQNPFSAIEQSAAATDFRVPFPVVICSISRLAGCWLVKGDASIEVADSQRVILRSRALKMLPFGIVLSIAIVFAIAGIVIISSTVKSQFVIMATAGLVSSPLGLVLVLAQAAFSHPTQVTLDASTVSRVEQKPAMPLMKPLIRLFGSRKGDLVDLFVDTAYWNLLYARMQSAMPGVEFKPAA